MGTAAGFEWDDGQLGVGVVTRLVRGSFVGAWVADFTLDSMGVYMAAIKADLHGAIFVASADITGQQDGYLISSSSSLLLAHTQHSVTRIDVVACRWFDQQHCPVHISK